MQKYYMFFLFYLLQRDCYNVGRWGGGIKNWEQPKISSMNKTTFVRLNPAAVEKREINQQLLQEGELKF
jgi:hypothetical protein